VDSISQPDKQPGSQTGRQGRCWSQLVLTVDCWLWLWQSDKHLASNTWEGVYQVRSRSGCPGVGNKGVADLCMTYSRGQMSDPCAVLACALQMRSGQLCLPF